MAEKAFAIKHFIEGHSIDWDVYSPENGVICVKIEISVNGEERAKDNPILGSALELADEEEGTYDY